MPLFRYEALDRTGSPVRGAMQVPDEQTLTVRLNSMGYQPVTIEMAPGARGAAAAASARTLMAAPAPAHVAPQGSKLSADERSISRMYYQLHQGFKAGMPAFQTLTTVQGQIRHPALHAALGEISLGVRDGHLISLLMERYPRIFSRGDIGMIRAAEHGGFLPEAFRSLAERMESDDNARRRLRIWVWFFHSNMLMLFEGLAVAVALPPFMASGLNPAVFFGQLGRWTLLLAFPLSAVYLGLLIWFYRARRDPKLAYPWHRALLKLPAVGKINLLRCHAVFTRTLQQLYHAGVSPAQAWLAASGAIPNFVLADRYMSSTPAVEGTGRFTVAMQQVGLLDPTDVGMVATGEATGEIGEALNYLANRYEEDTRVATGAAVFRGSLGFVTWSFILGGVVLIALAWGWYGNMIPAVNKFMGVE